MSKKRRFNLSSQLNLIFTAITLATSLLFIFIFRHTMKEIITNQANKYHEDYHAEISSDIENNNDLNFSEYFSTMEIHITNISHNKINYYIITEHSSNYNDIEKIELDNIIEEYIILREIIEVDKKITLNNKNIIGRRNANNSDRLILTISMGKYQDRLGTPINNIIIIGFISIILLGNGIILLWSSITVEKIKNLEMAVSRLSSDEYKKPIKIDGSDELTDLGEAIEKMRIEILQNEKVKHDILQNISHDIKTPISVIQSYAEAIIDGVSDPSEASVILEQTKILSRQAKQLIEWNKLEYIKNSKEFVLIDIKEVINDVVNNHKYYNKIDFELDLDNSKYLGIKENYYSAFSNLVDNALRYAETTIKITLKNEKLTFYNDGEHIADEFIGQIFKPYEKGHKGQFGLGMTIVQKTLTSFNLKLTIQNEDKGVSFIIEPE